ncbi:MAG: cysteine desulfurase family protein [Cyclobacteriaceae bacterium]
MKSSLPEADRQVRDSIWPLKNNYKHMKYPIYFDHNATTPCDQEVMDAMMPFMREHFGNASSVHHPYGWMAEEAVEMAREQVAHLVGAAPKEIVFTSGATESINLAIRGISQAHAGRHHFITLQTEHKAVLDTFAVLEEEGHEVTYLPVQKNGLVDLTLLEKSITRPTLMMAVMLANNETGVIQPIDEIGLMAKKHGVLLLSDAVQAVGKIPVDVKQLGVDLMPMSAHKFYGPKGVGALYVRKSKPQISMSPLITGGGHELGRRSGTLNVPGIVGMGQAATIARQELGKEAVRLGSLRNHLENSLLVLKDCLLNGAPEKRLPHVSNLSFGGIDGREFLIRINKELAISSGSACSSITDKPSHVLLAMGVNPNTAKATLRFGLGKSTDQQQIDFAIDFVKTTFNQLKEI